jgi:type II secretory pathway component GspD/PulD (secretin)
MRTEDSLSTRKGVNLLSALTLQFGGGGAPAFARTFSSNSALQSSQESNATATSLTRSISIPALSYALNIVNSNSNLNEVLARPTLAALHGVRSEFFSGTTLTAAVVATNAVGGSSVSVEKEIGVKLSILPTFLGDNKIQLTVDAQRTFLKPPSQDVSFTYKLETSKILVNANVVMEFGETLVLGGLSEKETTNTRDGVPVLQDIPGLQYLFSNKDTNDFQRSVLMLITPRAPQYTYRSDANMASASASAGAGQGGEDSMKELRARYGDWFKPYPNLASVFSQLNSSSIYREFRTGDVTLEKWDKQSTALDRLKQALDFLFY